MPHTPRHTSIGDLLSITKERFDIRAVAPSALLREVSCVTFFPSAFDEQVLNSALVVLTPIHDTESALAWSTALQSNSCVLLLPTPLSESELAQIFTGHELLVTDAGLDITRFVIECARILDPAEEQLARKLANTQAKFNLALTHPAPMQDLFRRVSRQLGGTTALLGSDFRIHASSGPLPLNQVLPSLKDDASPLIRIETEQWNGSAVRVATPSSDDEADGWLIGLVRAPRRFDSSQIAVLQLAAPLFDTLVQLRQASLEHDRAAGAAVLSQALEFRPQRHNAELQGKLLAHRISLAEDLHVVAIGMSELQPQTIRRRLSRVEIEIQSLLTAQSTPHLTTEVDQLIVCLIQAPVNEIRRLMESNSKLLAGTRAAVGRLVHTVGDIGDSYQDAVLGLRSGKLANRFSFASAEDFDFAFRLFSEIGLDRAVTWAREFLEPLWDREALLIGLQAFFAHAQNINAAADALAIHHNSLRYRLTKVEAALDLSLRSPSAIASLFLALNALDLGGVLKPFGSGADGGGVNQAASGDTFVQGGTSADSPSSGLTGVVLSVNR